MPNHAHTHQRRGHANKFGIGTEGHIVLLHLVEQRRQGHGDRCGCQAGLQQFQQTPTGGARERATGHAVRHSEKVWLQCINRAMFANTALMHLTIKQHGIFVTGLANFALTETNELNRNMQPPNQAANSTNNVTRLHRASIRPVAHPPAARLLIATGVVR